MRRESLKALFEEYFEAIRSYIFYRCGDPAVAEDIAQQTFLSLWEKQSRIIPGKEKALLFKMAGDAFIDYYRRKKLEADFSKGFRERQNNPTPEQILEAGEIEDRYKEALSKMSELSRIVFMMSRNEELKNREIADRLNISIKTVEKRMSLALKVLREELNQ